MPGLTFGLLYGFTEDALRVVGRFSASSGRPPASTWPATSSSYFYWVTREKAYQRAKEPIWQPVVDFIVTSRQATNGLLPPDRYAGDINQNLYVLSSNAHCWRGLRHMTAVLADLGKRDRADRLSREAKVFRQAILEAVATSERREVRPPFIPNALFGDEQPYEELAASRMGNPIQPELGGGIDVLVVKLNATGSAVLFSTYLGGSAQDNGRGIAVDRRGDA